MKLRMQKGQAPFHIVLVEPEIPQNTGNIARLCAATGAHLHLVEPLGFRTDEKAVRRAGLDYWHLVRVSQHQNLDRCLDAIGSISPLLFSTKAPRSYLAAPFSPGAALLFGKETKGLGASILEKYTESTFAIPTVEDTVRSLNLANSVSIVLYEALRVSGQLDRLTVGK